MKRFLIPVAALAFLFSFPPGPTLGQDVHYPEHFRVFSADGEPASLEDIVRAMGRVEVVLVGETHTDPVGHWIEAELWKGALAEYGAGEDAGMGRPLALSLEMFERDVQGIVDEYLQDLITESQFTASARPWEYYDPDYRPMVEMAKEARVPVIAANAPRRYVNRVTRLGRESLLDLSPKALSHLPPFPYPQPSETYREEWTSLMANMTMEQRCPPPPGSAADTVSEAGADTVSGAAPLSLPDRPPHRPEEDPARPADHTPMGGPPSHMGSFMENGLQAQALWDASMAQAVTSFVEAEPGALVLHMVGGFHVENFTGIPEKVQDFRPGTRILVVAMEPVEDFRSFDPGEHSGRGDFVILTDESLDLNYARNCSEVGGAG